MILINIPLRNLHYQVVYGITITTYTPSNPSYNCLILTWYCPLFVGFFWIQEMVYHLLHQDTLDTPIKEKDALANRLPFLEHEFRNTDPLTLLEDMPRPRAMKSHLPPQFFGKQLGENRNKTKILLWVQDPKDVMVNYHCFWNEKGGYFNFPKLEWEKFYDLFKKKVLFEGDWMDTNAAWLNEFDGQDNFLMLRYEDAAQDLEGTVKKLAKFLGVKCNGFKASRVAHVLPYDVRREWGDRWTEEQQKHLEDRYKAEMKGTALEGVYV